jgi:hypothetical protein
MVGRQSRGSWGDAARSKPNIRALAVPESPNNVFVRERRRLANERSPWRPRGLRWGTAAGAPASEFALTRNGTESLQNLILQRRPRLTL